MAIVAPLPNNIQNGQPEDATPVMANFNAIRANVNANALAIDGSTINAANQNFGGFALNNLGGGATQASAATVGQVQSGQITSLTAVAGTNTITANVGFALAAYATNQVFYFIPAATNTGPVTINITGAAALGAKAITQAGTVPLAGGELLIGSTAIIFYDGTRFQLLNAAVTPTGFYVYTSVGVQAILNGVGTTITFGTKLFDVGNNVTTGVGGVFTAPVAGIYSLSATITIDQGGVLTVPIPDYVVTINTSVGGVTTRNSAAVGAVPGLSANGLFNLGIGSTANVIISQNSGASMQTNVSQAGLFFCGFKVV